MKRSSTKRKAAANPSLTPVIDLDSLEVDIILRKAAAKEWKQTGEHAARKKARSWISMQMETALIERFERALIWQQLEIAELHELQRIIEYIDALQPVKDPRKQNAARHG